MYVYTHKNTEMAQVRWEGGSILYELKITSSFADELVLISHLYPHGFKFLIK